MTTELADIEDYKNVLRASGLKPPEKQDTEKILEPEKDGTWDQFREIVRSTPDATQESVGINIRSAQTQIKVGESFTDLANAQLLADLLIGRCLFVPQWGWLTYDGQRWAKDLGGHETCRLAGELLFKFFTQKALKKAAQRKELTKLALKIQSRRRLRDVIDLAKGYLLAKPSIFDTDPWLLNCGNGVVDLRTGELSPHSPDLYFTKLAGTVYRPETDAPRWMKFQQELFPGDATLIRYVKRRTGYSATGNTREDDLIICWGTGSNGKSTMLSTVRRVLGDYAQAVAPDLLLSRDKRGDTHPTILADLFGARFCSAIETAENRRLDATRVKSLTGRDPVKARFMNRDYFEFWPTHKLWLATNHRPIVEDTSLAMWRRIALIPFCAVFTKENGRRVDDLDEQLWQERAGILTWIVQGCLEWQREGFGDCQAVAEATQEYRKEMDVLHQWIEERCESDAVAVTLFAKLYEDYSQWCKERTEEPVTSRKFAFQLEEKGFEKTSAAGGNAARKRVKLQNS
ncbi:phage/plasmid primase, P4 family [Acidobacteria bacterium AH-259-O06]|nr:phage/plasmid primase, P4 family [Acidobacteria bacterium AH-259-O06]